MTKSHAIVHSKPRPTSLKIQTDNKSTTPTINSSVAGQRDGNVWQLPHQNPIYQTVLMSFSNNLCTKRL